jgi:hypothetical protein
LGAATQADRIEVRWPSGKIETMTAVPGDALLTIEEGHGVVSRSALPPSK